MNIPNSIITATDGFQCKCYNYVYATFRYSFTIRWYNLRLRFLSELIMTLRPKKSVFDCFYFLVEG